MSKNIIQKLFLVLIVGLWSFQGQSQGMKERTADKHYEQLAFIKAADMYSELADKSDATAHQIRRAAECYRFIGDSENAEKYYAKLVTNSEVKAEDFYHYAQMLKMNEKYSEADKAMKTFGGKKAGNSIAKSHSNNSNYVTELKSIPNKYSIALLDVNTVSSDFGPSYYKIDGQTHIAFASARTSNSSAFNKQSQWDGSDFLDVYEATIGVDGEKTKVKRFDRGIKSKYHEGPVSFSNNGMKMYLTRSNYLNKKKGLDSARHNNLKLYLSEKDSNGDWSDLKEFPFNSDYYSLGHATVTEDGETMYFSSDMPGGKGITDIWMSKKSGETWGNPVNVSDVNTEGREMFPFISEDGILYFSTDGHAGLGGLDVYRAKGSEASFGKAQNMMYPLNTNHDDFALIIGKDGKEGYFSSNRDSEDAVGDDDIYRFKMLVPFKPDFYTIKGCAKTKSEEIVENTTIKLINKETGETIEKRMSESGCYEFKELPEGEYKIVGSKENWDKISDFEVNTKDLTESNINNANVYLKRPDCMLAGKIQDTKDKTNLTGVIVKIKDKATGVVKTYVTDENGSFKDGLDGLPCPGATLDYDVELSKEGYYTKTVPFKKTITTPGVVHMNEFLSLEMKKKDKENTSVKEFCEISDILYDFNKSNIRPDAAAELDKLVSCMNQNPELIVEIGSHTDCRGSKRYNEKLSDRRAKSARAYVISKGISPSRIYGKGYGEYKLLNGCACEPTNKSNCSEEEHQLNRRTEFRIVSGGDNVKNNSTNSFDK